jgi:uncharacterized sporulation protein YeaH/YhbH (DUF444 family)
MPTQVKDMFKKEFENESKFVICEINENADVWKALKKFFSQNHGQQIRKIEGE